MSVTENNQIKEKSLNPNSSEEYYIWNNNKNEFLENNESENNEDTSPKSSKEWAIENLLKSNEISVPDYQEENNLPQDLTQDTIRIYLREIGKVTLLTAKDEVSLSQSIEEASLLNKLKEEHSDNELNNNLFVKNILKIYYILYKKMNP